MTVSKKGKRRLLHLTHKQKTALAEICSVFGEMHYLIAKERRRNYTQLTGFVVIPNRHAPGAHGHVSGIFLLHAVGNKVSIRSYRLDTDARVPVEKKLNERRVLPVWYFGTNLPDMEKRGGWIAFVHPDDLSYVQKQLGLSAPIPVQQMLYQTPSRGVGRLTKRYRNRRSPGR